MADELDPKMNDAMRRRNEESRQGSADEVTNRESDDDEFEDIDEADEDEDESES